MPISTTYGLQETDLPLLHLVQQGLLEREVEPPGLARDGNFAGASIS